MNVNVNLEYEIKKSPYNRLLFKVKTYYRKEEEILWLHGVATARDL
jgi:hypothetical protein